MLHDKEIRVCLIEDDEEDYILTKGYLREVTHRRYKLEWADTFEKGLEAIKTGTYDAYLVDYRLGGATGVELIKNALEDGSNAPLILLTGLGTPEIDDMAMKVGAADYLIKSNINAETLDRSIRYSINQYRLLQEVKALHAESEQRVTERTWELAGAINELEKTNRNLMEEMAAGKKAREEKEKSQKLYFTIGENYPNGFIAVFNKDMEYVFMEGRLLDDLGMNKAEWVGKRFGEYFSPVEIANMEQSLHTAFHGHRKAFELVFHGRTLQSYALPLLESDGHIEQVMVVTQDITERKKAIEEISNALDKEKILNELKSRFVSMASHEFRTPLGTILSSVSLIGKYNAPGDDEKREKHIARIKSAVANLTGILNDFLSLSKLEEGKTSNTPHPVNLPEICAEVVEEIQVTAKTGQEIHLENKGELSEINIDRQILKNILINLTSNAIKYSPENKPVFVFTEVTKKNLVIRVTDQGIGIPIEDQKHLFESFFRAGNVTNIQGTGLGLNIVKRYVDLLGGDIDFISVPDQGTTFCIELDLEKLKNPETIW